MEAAELFDAMRYLLNDPDGKFGGNLLGEYYYINAPKTPELAISIDYAPSTTIDKIYGLECIIPLVGDGESIGLSPGVIQQDKDWDVLLVQKPPPLRDDPELYTEADEPKLRQAIKRIETVFAFSYLGKVTGHYTGRDSALGSYPQYRMTLTTEEFEKVHGFVNQLQN